MFPHQTKGIQVDADGDSASNEKGPQKETVVDQMRRLQFEQVQQREAQENLRVFLHRTKIAARQVRSVTSRPGIAPRPEVLAGKSRSDAEKLRGDYLKNAIDAIKKQKDDVSSLVDAYISRVNKQNETNPDIHVDWNQPGARARLTEIVVNLVADMWESESEEDYKGRFMDFIEFTARMYEKDDPGYATYMDNSDADRFLALHNAFLTIDAALSTLHPLTPRSIFTGAEPVYRLLFGRLADLTSMERTHNVLDDVIYPLVGKCCQNVEASLTPGVKLSKRDKHIMFRSMIGLVTKDAEAIIRHEGLLLLNWVKSIPKESRDKYLMGDGALKSWLKSRLEQRLDQFYPNPTNFFDRQPDLKQAGAGSDGLSATKNKDGSTVQQSAVVKTNPY